MKRVSPDTFNMKLHDNAERYMMALHSIYQWLPVVHATYSDIADINDDDRDNMFLEHPAITPGGLSIKLCDHTADCYILAYIMCNETSSGPRLTPSFTLIADKQVRLESDIAAIPMEPAEHPDLWDDFYNSFACEVYAFMRKMLVEHGARYRIPEDSYPYTDAYPNLDADS